jgi:excisionase family DNA binding protein
MKELLIGRLLSATPDQLVAVEAVFNGKIEPNPMPPVSTRMFDNGQAAKSLGVSRQTVRRMIAAGRLPTVEIRAGRFRVPEQEIIKLVATATAKGDRA